MKKIKTMLLGIVFILFGIYGSSFAILSGTSNAGFYILTLCWVSMFSPYIGIIIFLNGFFMKETSDESEEKEEENEK